MLLSPSLLNFDLAQDDPERVIIYASSEPAIVRAQRLGVDARDEEITLELQQEANELVTALRRNGMRLKVIDILTHTTHVIIADVYNPTIIIEDWTKGLSRDIEIDRDIILKVNLQRSIPLVGADIARDYINAEGLGLDGEGVVIAVVDTGIDYNHPDLGGGIGPGHKVIAGYDFVGGDDDPMDEQGHGTHVAGIIAGSGGITGMAPGASLLAYRVVENSGRVRTSNVARALDRAVLDGADVINLSLGTRFTVEALNDIVRNAMDVGVIVVAAVGNSGPAPGSIGAPASDIDTIAVGAEYNDRPVRLGIMTIPELGLEIIGLPMEDSPEILGELRGEVVFVNYARPEDVDGIDLEGKIALARRRGETPDEIVFFSEKEAAVASRGGKGLIVFNTEPGIIRGRLIHPDNPSGYNPSIPTVFITMDQGEEIMEALSKGDVIGTLAFENRSHTDKVSLFSSRGPISQFYIKPDLISPGEQVNSTWPGGGYSIQDGTSFAAPHVTGAVALLLQLHGTLTRDQVMGILGPSATPLENAFGEPWPADHQGSGRLDMEMAVKSPMTIVPHQLSINLAYGQPRFETSIRIDSLVDDSRLVTLLAQWDSSDLVSFAINTSSFELAGMSSEYVNISAHLVDDSGGNSASRMDGWLIINVDSHDEMVDAVRLTVPFVVSINPVSINVTRNERIFEISLISPSLYEIGTVRIIGPGRTISEDEIVPGELSSFSPQEAGEHWVEIGVLGEDGLIFGAAIFTVSADVPAPSPEIEVAQIIPVRFLQILLGSLSLIAIGAAIYVAAAGRSRTYV